MRPIVRPKQFITQKFHTGHPGVDLRCMDDSFSENLPVVATERCQVLRQGKDKYGNYFLVVKPLQNTEFKEIKYIHIGKTNFEESQVLDQDEYISHCIIGGNSKALHLHFEVWKDESIDPLEYFNTCGIEY